jgi:hypothetical protein
VVAAVGRAVDAADGIAADHPEFHPSAVEHRGLAAACERDAEAVGVVVLEVSIGVEGRAEHRERRPRREPEEVARRERGAGRAAARRAGEQREGEERGAG